MNFIRIILLKKRQVYAFFTSVTSFTSELIFVPTSNLVALATTSLETLSVDILVLPAIKSTPLSNSPSSSKVSL